MRKVLGVLLVIVVLAGIGGVFAYREGVHPALVLWIVRTSWERTESFEATVQGDVDVLGMTLTTAGKLRHKKPELYDLDMHQLRVMAGPKALWVIVPAVKTAFRVHAKEMSSAQILRSLIGQWDERDPSTWVESAVRRPAEVTLYRAEEIEGERCWVLEWPARTGESIGGRVYISQRTRWPVRFDQMTSGGEVLATYLVRDFRANTGLGAGDFEYSPMPGYSVVDYEYDPEEPLALEGLILPGSVDAPKLRKKLDKIEKQLPEGASKWLRRHGLSSDEASEGTAAN